MILNTCFSYRSYLLKWIGITHLRAGPMGTSNGLDDFSEEAICEYAESYGYIHELDVKGLKEALEGLGYTVLTEKEAKYCIIQ